MNTQFNAIGIATVAIIFWITAQNASGDARTMFNLFLGVLLLSMVILNWSKIQPIFFKGGTKN
ncbi:hypothetical protein [Alicyclobacillus acidoterrestris]|uniref:Uncharacterized protein n=1 Tax=Alicyclobacillus acidoterrestris (strain ATCC 49025 / DSM 3922 / CIP 106132 / NCIMB 13137 / GD3B) TaxID=1356854 RepID=T0D239_ALIAG|nr:hypothetical protein [Alicyclobacillus acidoterrestris]EPZ43831.1 hypothetical protein N007_11990 [Alicyclobacillus acidoterrestris ATCC 49025]UNO49036.1 hypothetical protein K1I37_00215 [Alicyclobacillus acidoterrestris]